MSDMLRKALDNDRARAALIVVAVYAIAWGLFGLLWLVH